MNRDTLTLLGCSGSLLLMVATGSAAKAEAATPLYGDFVSTIGHGSKAAVFR